MMTFNLSMRKLACLVLLLGLSFQTSHGQTVRGASNAMDATESVEFVTTEDGGEVMVRVLKSESEIVTYEFIQAAIYTWPATFNASDTACGGTGSGCVAAVRDVVRLTEIFYRRYFASLYSVSFTDAFCNTLRDPIVRSLSPLEVEIDFLSQVSFRTVGIVPTPTEAFDDIVRSTSTDDSENIAFRSSNNDDYIEHFVRRTKPADLFPFVDSVQFFTNRAPTASPSRSPTRIPSASPSHVPSVSPSRNPTDLPSVNPTNDGPTTSMMPTTSPSEGPSSVPSRSPSDVPSVGPTLSIAPSRAPSRNPSSQPSMMPSSRPTPESMPPSLSPSESPSRVPSKQPSDQPSFQPSNSPSRKPSAGPSEIPSAGPSEKAPSNQPSREPSESPSLQPSESPSLIGTAVVVVGTDLGVVPTAHIIFEVQMPTNVGLDALSGAQAAALQSALSEFYNLNFGTSLTNYVANSASAEVVPSWMNDFTNILYSGPQQVTASFFGGTTPTPEQLAALMGNFVLDPLLEEVQAIDGLSAATAVRLNYDQVS